jgi:alpha-galactosidase
MTELPAFFRIDGAQSGLVFDLRRGLAELVHAGSTLAADEDLIALCDSQRRGRRQSQPDSPEMRPILPQSGWGYGSTPAVLLMENGVLLPSRFVLNRVEGGGDTAQFGFSDEASGAHVQLDWRIAASGVIVASSTLVNGGAAPIQIAALASLALPLPHWATHILRYGGRWAGEMQSQRMPLASGGLANASRGGRPGFGGGGWVRFEEGSTTEIAGRSLAAHLAWSGDGTLAVEQAAGGAYMLLMGARLDPGEITLAPGEMWTAPDAILAIGDSGLADTRARFHRYAADEILPAAAKTQRKIHLNSWEAFGFNMDCARLMRLADDAAALGVERFVLDDGWFQGRRDDTTSLGDWTPDAALFPDGLEPLIKHVHARGMDFGLWVEPEMVSPDSDLYRAHPDWCVHVPEQPRPTQRNQLVLDLTRSDVFEYLFGMLDGLLCNHAIAYLKWDHNRDLFPLAGKGHAQVQALYRLLERLRTAHPELEIESCASGGGRVDFEILKRCTRVWASDNNDAIERLRINAGWFGFLPLKAVGNHIGPSPNPTTGRRLPMDFRAKVAMFGHLGVEADPAMMSEGERASLKAHAALYKVWRPVLHDGWLTAIGCGDPDVFGWLACSGDRGLALAAQTAFSDRFDVPPVCLFGLQRDAFYNVRLIEPWPKRAAPYLADPDIWRAGLRLSGRALAETGLALPLTQPETAWLIAVERCA